MSIVRQCRRAMQRILFGDTLLPQEFFLGLREPHKEVTVWLHGMGPPLDVTCRHSMVCASPLTLCIALDEGDKLRAKKRQNLSLRFCEPDERKRVLGEIGLRWIEDVHVEGIEAVLFRARSSTNHCLPKIHLGVHYLLHSYMQRSKVDTSGMKMSFLERRAAMVMFICPRPVVLVSLVDEVGGNIFPMNLMGELGNGYFAFALKDTRRAAHLVERTGRIAVSSLPISHAPLAYQLAVNHTRDSIDWDQVPFATTMSPKFRIPVPVFALRVREMEIVRIHRLGSHSFFVARITHDETFSYGSQLCVIHGFYQAWRLRGRSVELQASLAEDGLSKRGF
jgi:flavin reductase (DIM6/NTAB) family NADH-FMN oxidoreductase RutF